MLTHRAPPRCRHALVAPPQLEATPIDTKGFQSLLSLVDNTANDSFDLYYGLFMYNQVRGRAGAPAAVPLLMCLPLHALAGGPTLRAAPGSCPARSHPALPLPCPCPVPAPCPVSCRITAPPHSARHRPLPARRTPRSSWTGWRRRLTRSRRAC